MKFGKRLAAEASRRWRGSFLDYKAIKRAIQLDVECRGEARIYRISKGLGRVILFSALTPTC